MKKFATIDEINAAAQGNWPAVLEAAGVPRELLNTHKHQPCPACGGTDRYRFTDHKGAGVWICNQCQPEGGSPLDLLMAAFGYSLREAKDVLADVLGLAHGDTERREPKPLPTPVPKKDDEREKWQPILPVPEFALKSMNFAHGWRKAEDMLFSSVFRDTAGQVLGAVVRFKKSDGGKIDMPYTFCRHVDTGVQKWCWRGWESPRPLYGLDALASTPDLPVLVVEGEKCKNAADAATLPFAVVTWHGGCNNWDKADWSAIANRRVVLWPDCDSERERLSKSERSGGAVPESKPYKPREEQGGWRAMQGIAARLAAQGCDVHTVAVPVPGVWPHGYDIADALADGGKLVDPAAVLSWQHAPDWLVAYNQAGDGGGAFPAPQSDDDAHGVVPLVDGGAGDDVAAADAESQYNQHFDTLKREYGLVEGKERAVNRKTGVEYSRRALVVHFCKKSVESWFNWGRAPVFTQYEINRIKRERVEVQAATDGDVQEMMARYIYLDGSSSIWDNTLWRMIDEKSARLAMTPDGFKVWVNSPMRMVKRFDRLVFEPGREMPAEYINIYRGLPFADKVTLPMAREDMPLWWLDVCKLFSGCRAIQRLIAHLCNDDLQAIEFIYNWLAYPLQNVGAKMTTALVFHGDVHGAGKSFLFEEIIKPMYGDYAVTLGQSDLESAYTGNRAGKLFVLFEEIFNNKQKYDQSGAMKHMITGKTMRVERKFVDAYEEANHINCVFLSNEPQPFKIEENDRRYFVVWPKRKLPQGLRQDLVAELGNGGIEQFFMLLLSLPLTLNYDRVATGDDADPWRVERTAAPRRFDPNTEPPMTAAKRDVISYGRYGWQTFYAEWAAGDIADVPFCSCIAEDLWQLYKWWCGKNDERGISRTKFLQHIASKMHRSRRWWRLPNSNRPQEKTQDTIFMRKDAAPPAGMAEMDFLGPEVFRFRGAVGRCKGIAVDM